MKRKPSKKGVALPAWVVPTVIGLALAGATVYAWPPREQLEPHVRDGNKAFEERDFAKALQQYEAAPGDGVPNAGVHMNRGLARFRMAVPAGDGGVLPELSPDAAVPESYQRAQDEMRNTARGFGGAPMEDIDAVLRARAHYNLGNTYFAQHLWQSAIDQYKEALRLRPGWANPAWNLELARRRKDEDEHPDAGPDASQDASQDASRDGSSSGDGGNNQGDGGNNQGDGGRPSQPDGGASPDGGGENNQAPDAGAQPPPELPDGGGAPPPTSLAPLDQLERNAQDLQQMLMRRRARAPRGPDDDR